MKGTIKVFWFDLIFREVTAIGDIFREENTDL
jgi:hypothetical protein